MTAYIVRHKERKSLLGLFVAPNLAFLWDAVDEFTDPSDYEFRKVSHGAVVYPEEEPRAFIGDNEDADFDNTGQCRVEHSYDLFSAWHEDDGWRVFPYADQAYGLIARVMRQHPELAKG